MSSIADLRKHLFETLEALKDKGMPVERAKAIAEVAQTIINSAKVEVDFMRMRGERRGGTGFVPEEPPALGQPRLVKGRAQSGSED